MTARVEFAAGRGRWPFPPRWGRPHVANANRLSDDQVEDVIRRWAVDNILAERVTRLELRKYPTVPGCMRGELALSMVRLRERPPWGG